MTTTDTTRTDDWSTVATGWDTHRARVEAGKDALHHRILDSLALQPGEQVLELGAGTGEFATQLAAAVGDRGRVLATDQARGMVDLIARTVYGSPNVEVSQADAAAIDQADGSFDAVVFCFGLMFVPEAGGAMAEIRRVLRPGGRVAIATWAGPELNPWLVNVGMASVMSGVLNPGGGPMSPGGPLSIADPAQLEALATAAGFRDVSAQRVDLPFRVPDAATHLEHVSSLAPPIAEAFASATDDQRAAVLTMLEQSTAQFRTDDGLQIPGQALLLIAS